VALYNSFITITIADSYIKGACKRAKSCTRRHYQCRWTPLWQPLACLKCLRPTLFSSWLTQSFRRLPSLAGN